MRFAYCALQLPYCEPGGYWIARSSRAMTVSSGTASKRRHRPLFASDVTQPCMRDFAFSMSFLVKKSSGFTLSTG
jgi:hypothetical protein